MQPDAVLRSQLGHVLHHIHTPLNDAYVYIYIYTHVCIYAKVIHTYIQTDRQTFMLKALNVITLTAALPQLF